MSTDEVYGSPAPANPAFTERALYALNSPYAASKAALDHLMQSYQGETVEGQVGGDAEPGSPAITVAEGRNPRTPRQVLAGGLVSVVPRGAIRESRSDPGSAGSALRPPGPRGAVLR